jgi:tRNA threonylcarbamoyladenosine biosynthesis protein TsaE
MRYVSTSCQQTRAYGAACARSAAPGSVYALAGELGCGKTEFVRGFVAAIAPLAPVRSPSFALVYTYETPLFPVYHFDFYRLKNSAELTQIGLDDYIRGNGVCLIEWADMFVESLPQNSSWIRFYDNGAVSRIIETAVQLTEI